MKHFTKRQKIALIAFVLILTGIGFQIMLHIVSDGTANLLSIASLVIYETILFHAKR